MGYDLKRIAFELDATANGISYYGNALYVALDLPEITAKEKSMLNRYLYGSELSNDRFLLQELAIKLRGL